MASLNIQAIVRQYLLSEGSRKALNTKHQTQSTECQTGFWHRVIYIITGGDEANIQNN